MSVVTGKLETVRSIYDDFGRGDIPALLARLADDVAWDCVSTSAHEQGVPWLAARRGRDQVGEFFQALASALDFHGFEVVELFEGTERVAALIRVDVTVRATGIRFQDDEVHIWELDEGGLVTSLRHILDTGKHIAAAGAAR